MSLDQHESSPFSLHFLLIICVLWASTTHIFRVFMVVGRADNILSLVFLFLLGGYHPVQQGEVFNKRYKVLSKLGWGYFSTVWLCIDLRCFSMLYVGLNITHVCVFILILCLCSRLDRSGRHVAVKVLKSGAGFTQAGQDELKLLRCVSPLFLFLCLFMCLS